MTGWKHVYCEHITRFIVQHQKYFQYVFQSQHVKRNQLLYLMDDPAHELYIVLSGAVRLTVISEDGREEILSIRREGDPFGALCLCPEYYWDHQATVHEDGTIARMKAHDFYRVFYGHDEVLRAFLAFFAGELTELQNFIKDLQKIDAKRRTVHYLYRQIQTVLQERSLPDECKLVITPIVHRIAENTGLPDAEVEAVLKSLKSDGVLDWKRNSLTIRTARLESILDKTINTPNPDFKQDTTNEPVRATA